MLQALHHLCGPLLYPLQQFPVLELGSPELDAVLQMGPHQGRVEGLVEAGGGLRAPGDSVHLSCRGSGFNFAGYAVRWYRQAPGGSLEWVSYISKPSGSTKRYGAAVEGRATVSRDNSHSESSLSLRALRPQDSARYFCAVPTETGNAAEL
uniref:Ig-like domain-containing protein n=1 Tax=Calidris pygmaea TaxID=425635 RepID=A0A8C3K565_9CHAR